MIKFLPRNDRRENRHLERREDQKELPRIRENVFARRSNRFKIGERISETTLNIGE